MCFKDNTFIVCKGAAALWNSFEGLLSDICNIFYFILISSFSLTILSGFFQICAGGVIFLHYRELLLPPPFMWTLAERLKAKSRILATPPVPCEATLLNSGLLRQKLVCLLDKWLISHSWSIAESWLARIQLKAPAFVFLVPSWLKWISDTFSRCYSKLKEHYPIKLIVPAVAIPPHNITSSTAQKNKYNRKVVKYKPESPICAFYQCPRQSWQHLWR